MKADVIMVIGANPTDGHPVFASQMKRRLRAGREADRRRSARHRSRAHAARRGGLPPAAAARHQRRADQRARARDRDRGPDRRGRTSPSAASADSYEKWKAFVAEPRNSPEATASRSPACRPQLVRAAARLYATAGNGAIYYGLGVTEHSQGSTMVMGIANLAMATGNIGREGVGVNPLRGQNNVQGSCDMGSFPHEFPGYRHVSDDADARAVRERRGACTLRAEPGPAHSEHVRSRARRQLQGPVHPGRGHRAVRSRTRST